MEPPAEARIAIPARMTGAWNRGDAACYFAGHAASALLAVAKYTRGLSTPSPAHN
jgi:hypothetical protein